MKLLPPNRGQMKGTSRPKAKTQLECVGSLNVASGDKLQGLHRLFRLHIAGVKRTTTQWRGRFRRKNVPFRTSIKTCPEWVSLSFAINGLGGLRFRLHNVWLLGGKLHMASNVRFAFAIGQGYTGCDECLPNSQKSGRASLSRIHLPVQILHILCHPGYVNHKQVDHGGLIDLLPRPQRSPPSHASTASGIPAKNAAISLRYSDTLCGRELQPFSHSGIHWFIHEHSPANNKDTTSKSLSSTSTNNEEPKQISVRGHSVFSRSFRRFPSSLGVFSALF